MPFKQKLLYCSFKDCRFPQGHIRDNFSQGHNFQIFLNMQGNSVITP